MNRANIEYSETYQDDEYEYRQVILPRELGALVKTKGLLSESQCRKLGVVQSKGWEHYSTHLPEPHILLFRRLIGSDPRTGKLNPKLVEAYTREADLRRRQMRG